MVGDLPDNTCAVYINKINLKFKIIMYNFNAIYYFYLLSCTNCNIKEPKLCLISAMYRVYFF